MSLVLYTTGALDISDIQFIPTETIYVNAENIDSLPKEIHTLPAVIKTIGDCVTVIQGDEVAQLESLTIQEQVNQMDYCRK